MTDVIKGSGRRPGPIIPLSELTTTNLRQDPAYNPTVGGQPAVLTLADRIKALGDRCDSITTINDIHPLVVGKHRVHYQDDDQGGHLVVTGGSFALLIPMSAVVSVGVRVTT